MILSSPSYSCQTVPTFIFSSSSPLHILLVFSLIFSRFLPLPTNLFPSLSVFYHFYPFVLVYFSHLHVLSHSVHFTSSVVCTLYFVLLFSSFFLFDPPSNTLPTCPHQLLVFNTPLTNHPSQLISLPNLSFLFHILPRISTIRLSLLQDE